MVDHAPAPSLRFGVLGPLTAEGPHGPVALRGPRHRAVLARLLVARGRVVPVARLVDDLWTDPPEGARGALQTFVGELRRAVEPDRPPRAPARLLVTAAPGYALRAAPDAVDAERFEAALADSERLLAAGTAERARAVLDEALAAWRGPAYAEFADRRWARGEADRLDALRVVAAERRSEAVLALGGAAGLVPELEARVAADPLREDAWRLLVLALYRSGRQGDALGALRRARDSLRAVLGVDPGPALRQLETDVLAQSPHLTAPHLTAPHLTAPSAIRSGPTAPPAHEPGPDPFVGRATELARLEAAAAAASIGGRPGLALISGAAGAGKTALVRQLAGRLGAGGWTVAHAASPELPAGPGGWPWARLVEQLASAGFPPAATDDPGTSPALRHRTAVAHLCRASNEAPVLLVLDDLHWADEETLGLVSTLGAEPDAGAVLVVGTYRTGEQSPALAAALARMARAEPTRVELGGLGAPEVTELVRALAGDAVPAQDAAVIGRRSAGNPFFVRELTRLREEEGPAALEAVPAGVRDLVRHRHAALPEPVRTHLRQAAVLGSDVDVDVLITLTGDEEQLLTSVETALVAGLLVEDGTDGLRFSHDLVRETLYADVPAARRARWHVAAADALEELRPADAAAIAAHLVRAGSVAHPARTARAAAAAATQAEDRAAVHDAARLWGATIAALDRSVPVQPRARLEAVMGLVRALAVTGDLAEARRHRATALDAAEAVGDPVLAAGVIGSFDVPAVWTANDDEALAARLVAAAERTLAALPVEAVTARARLLATVAVERRGDATPKGREAAEEAVALARRLEDPGLLARALNGRFLQTCWRAGLAPERAVVGAELVDVARTGGLPTFEVLGHLVLLQSAAALGDLTAADRHAAAADELADRYELPVVGVFTRWYAALRLAVRGNGVAAEAAYRAAAGDLAGTGMAGVEDGLLPLALLSLRPSSPPSADADFGPHGPWVRPLRPSPDGGEAPAVPGSPHDLLLELRTCLHARSALRTGDLATAARLHERLLPAEDELAGAGSGLVTLGPVAQHLGDLAAALGRPEQARAHHRRAREVAARAGAAHWVADAEGALR